MYTNYKTMYGYNATNYKTMYEYNATSQNVYKLQKWCMDIMQQVKCIQTTQQCMNIMQQVKMYTNYKTMYE